MQNTESTNTMTHNTPEGLPPLPAPDSFLFQHEETGNTQFVDGQQVEWGFEKHNPRLQKIGGVYTESQMNDRYTQGYNDAREALRAQAASPEDMAVYQGIADGYQRDVQAASVVPVDRGHLSDLRYVLNVLWKAHAIVDDQSALRGEISASIVGMKYVIARTETASAPPAHEC